MTTTTQHRYWRYTALTVAAMCSRGSHAQSPIPTDEEIRKILVQRVDEEHRGTGMVVGIITPEGRRIIAYGNRDIGMGPVDANTVFEIGSVSKVFTSLMLTDEVQRGEVSLDDPVKKFLPRGVKVPEWQGHPIRLVDLSTQTSGLPFFPTNLDAVGDPDSARRYTFKRLYEFLSTYELLHDVGVHWEYTNLGVGLLGDALADRENTDYEGLLRNRIVAQLKLKSTGITITRSMRTRLAVGHDSNLRPTPLLDLATMQGAGCIRSTANDLLSFLGDFMGYSRTPLASAMQAMLATKRQSADWLMYLGGQQALGWWILGSGDGQIIAHAGETLGCTASIAYNPSTRCGVVVLCNGASGGEDLAMHFLRPSYPLSQKGAPPKTPTETSVDPKLYDNYVGRFEAGPYAIEVVYKFGDKLMFMAPGTPMVQLHHETGTTFFIAESDVKIDFVVGPDGRATGIKIHAYGSVFPANRVG